MLPIHSIRYSVTMNIAKLLEQSEKADSLEVGHRIHADILTNGDQRDIRITDDGTYYLGLRLVRVDIQVFLKVCSERQTKVRAEQDRCKQLLETETDPIIIEKLKKRIGLCTANMTKADYYYLDSELNAQVVK